VNDASISSRRPVEDFMLRHRNLPALAAALCLVVACDGGGNAEPATVPPTSEPPRTSASTVPVTTVTAVPAATTTTLPVTSVPDGPRLSDGGPWRLVDSAPGITTPGLFYELMPQLWVYLPLVEDIEHGITWTFHEEDREVIEAYLQARLVFFRTTQTNPFDLTDPGWAQWYTDGGASYHSMLTERSNRGEVFDLDAGLVLRPEVIGDGRTDTSAIVFDCMRDGSVWRLPNGQYGPGTTPGVINNGASAVADKSSDGWKIEGLAKQVEACV
jgi:hypothetical protein